MKLHIVKIIACVSFAIIFAGCASFFIPQKKWSENFALDKNGGRCNHREMNDGSLETSAKIGLELFPVEYQRSSLKGINKVLTVAEATDAILTLPQPTQIDRMVIYTPNLYTFEVYSSIYDGEHNWNLFAKVENSREQKVVIDRSVLADTFLIKVREVAVGNPNNQRYGHQQGKRVYGAPGIKLWATIQEIELYAKKKRGHQYPR